MKNGHPLPLTLLTSTNNIYPWKSAHWKRKQRQEQVSKELTITKVGTKVESLKKREKKQEWLSVTTPKELEAQASVQEGERRGAEAISLPT